MSGSKIFMVYGLFSVIFLVDNKIWLCQTQLGNALYCKVRITLNATTKEAHPDSSQLFVCQIWLTLRS